MNEFWRRMAARLGDEFEAFCRASDMPASVGVRLRRAPEGWFDEFCPRPVPWHPDGLTLARRPNFTLDPLFHAGGYYVQEPSSMIVYQAAAGVVGRESRVLDLCAAPGGKTTLLLALEPAVVVANEPIASRLPALTTNLAKFAAVNAVVSRADPEAFDKPCFDFVLVDAPCSGEGLWRKTPEARRQWSSRMVAACAARQARILDAAYRALKPGGR
ncbi:MAG: RsmB/NOP family class I SAM-dependent RNA methyltransferase, partial [Bacteroidia bacterium]|nr:RsmB/NOP family class I SAM-dependent RNA methyltransferase [Bacteroidia bacterium]MDW8334034.1 RsmB/NOP family class I SAM-dependent RNA methyltransferase [Bacteroidia bacterium]